MSDVATNQPRTSKDCPTCGQSLLNAKMAERVERAMAAQEKSLRAKLRGGIKSEVAAELESKHAGEMARAQAQVEALKRRLESKSAHDRGEVQERDVLEMLRAAFPADRLDRTGGGRRGDILHRVAYDGQDVGTILYECKDTATWQNRYVAKLKDDGRKQRTPYLVLVTGKLPAKVSGFCVRDDVVVCQPAHAVHLAQVIRRMVVETHRAGASAKDKSYKAQRLMEYLAGPGFRGAFEAVTSGLGELSDQLASERSSHERNWRRRQELHGDMLAQAHGVNDSIREIVEDKSPDVGERAILDQMLEMPELNGAMGSH